MRLIDAFLALLNIETIMACVPSAQVNMPTIAANTMPGTGQTVTTSAGTPCTGAGFQLDGATANFPVANGGSVTFRCPGGMMAQISGPGGGCSGVVQPCNAHCVDGSIVYTTDGNTQDTATGVMCNGGGAPGRAGGT